MIALIANILQAQGSTVVLQNPGDSQPITTPYGEVPKHMARFVCASQGVFIGKIVNSTPKERTDANGYTRILSDIELNIERNLYGTHPTLVPLTVPGGTLNGKTVASDRMFPDPKVGSRYLIGYSLLKQDTTYKNEGSPFLNVTFWITPESPLPIESFLQQELGDFCENNQLPRYHDVMGY